MPAGALVLISFIFCQKERKQINSPFIHHDVLFKFDEQIFHHRRVSQKGLPLASGLEELAGKLGEDYCLTAAVIGGWLSVRLCDSHSIGVSVGVLR